MRSKGATFVIGRTFYWSQAATTGGNFILARPVTAPIPGTAAVVATYGSGGHYVLLDNGDTYTAGGDAAQWEYLGNIFGGAPVPTRQGSWGAVKERYR